MGAINFTLKRIFESNDHAMREGLIDDFLITAKRFYHACHLCYHSSPRNFSGYAKKSPTD
jgi:hypothetical protein